MMTLKQRFQVLLFSNPGAQFALAELGYVQPAKTHKAARERGAEEGFKIGLKKAVAVLQACRRAGLDLQQAEKMISEGMDLAAAMKSIAAINSDRAALAAITGKSGSGNHRLIECCENMTNPTRVN